MNFPKFFKKQKENQIELKKDREIELENREIYLAEKEQNLKEREQKLNRVALLLKATKEKYQEAIENYSKLREIEEQYHNLERKVAELEFKLKTKNKIIEDLKSENRELKIRVRHLLSKKVEEMSGGIVGSSLYADTEKEMLMNEFTLIPPELTEKEKVEEALKIIGEQGLQVPLDVIAMQLNMRADLVESIWKELLAEGSITTNSLAYDLSEKTEKGKIIPVIKVRERNVSGFQ